MSNLPHGVLFSDIPGESRHDQLYTDTVEEIIHILNCAMEDGVDELHVLQDLVDAFWPCAKGFHIAIRQVRDE